MRFLNKKGFTLVELLIVIVVIGILASLALPKYKKSAERAKAGEALYTLGAMRKAMDVYYVENDSTYPGSVAKLSCNVPASEKFVYTISASNDAAETYTLKATRQAPGSFAGGYIAIDQDGNKSEGDKYQGII